LWEQRRNAKEKVVVQQQVEKEIDTQNMVHEFKSMLIFMKTVLYQKYYVVYAMLFLHMFAWCNWDHNDINKCFNVWKVYEKCMKTAWKIK